MINISIQYDSFYWFRNYGKCFIEQCSYPSLNQISFFQWELGIMPKNIDFTICIWKVKLKSAI